MGSRDAEGSVLAAMLARAIRDVRDHKLFAARAVVMSWMFLIPWVVFTTWVYGSARDWADAWTSGSVGLHDAWFFYQAPLMMVWCVGSVMTGWMIAKVHADYRAGTLAICAASQLPWAIQWGRPIWRFANAGLPFFRSVPVMVDVVVVFLVMPLSLLLGGLWAGLSDRDRLAPRPTQDV